MPVPVEPASLRAFLNLAVVPLFVLAAAFILAGRPRNAASRLLAAYLGLLAVRSVAGGMVDVAGATTADGAAWSAAFFDLNFVTFTVFLALAACLPRALSPRTLVGALWWGAVALLSLDWLGWLVARDAFGATFGGMTLIGLGVDALTFLVPASVLLVAWRARDLEPADRDGAVLLVVSAAISTYVATGGNLVGTLADGASLAWGGIWLLVVAVGTSLFFLARWRLAFPLGFVAFGAAIVLSEKAVGFDFSSFALALAVRALAPVYVAQRSDVLALGERPPRWLVRTGAFVALAALFVMANVVMDVVFQGDTLAAAIGVFAGLSLGVLAAMAVLPPGPRALFGAPAPAPLVAAPAVDARYRFERHLGEGGQGRADLHFDTKLQRRVVMKRVAGDASGTAMREARALARLHHENVVRVYDAEADGADGVVVMEHVEGGDLAGLLRRHSGALPQREARRIAREMLEGLAASHDAGLVHGDVKPENVLLTSEGRVKLADFGNARSLAGATLVAGGGTLRYMSPEQLRGEKPTARSDVYAAGAVLYEMLTRKWHLGDASLDAGTVPMRALTMEADLRLPPEVAPLEPLLRRALARDPSARFASAREMGDALAATLPAV